MQDFMENEGELSVSIGEGWISQYELSQLKAGCVIRSQREAGYSSIVLFNSLPLAHGEVVVMRADGGEEIVGIRLTNLFPSPFTLTPGRKSEALSLLPFYLRIASVRLKLGDLEGAGVGSIINMDRLHDGEEDAALVVAGIPAAMGKIVVLGEIMGLRVTRPLHDGWPLDAVQASGSVLFPEWQPKYKDYNFKMPDRFSKRQINTARSIHELFQDNLRLRSPNFAARLEGTDGTGHLVIDQLTWGEYWDGLQGRGDFDVIELKRKTTFQDAEKKKPTPGSAIIIEGKNREHPVGEETRRTFAAYIDRNAQVGGASRSVWLFVAKALDKNGSARGAIMASLAAAWNNYGDIGLADVRERGSMVGGEATREELFEHEMILLATRTREDGEPLMALAYPYPMLEPYLGLLG